MPRERTLTVTLPEATVDLIGERLASGTYGSTSEIIRAGLDALADREADAEAWLRSEGVARYDAVKADPDAVISAGEAFVRLRLRNT